MSDAFTTLNPGAGGSNIDEESVTYGAAPTDRRRARVILAGAGLLEIAEVKNAEPAPAGTEYGILARLAGKAAVKLYDSAGVELAVSNGVAIPVGTRGIILAGSDGVNTRFLGVNASGQAAIQNPSNLDVALSTILADATFTTRINTQGQKLMADSTPVVLASNQSTLPISVASLPLPSGAATLAAQTQPGVDIGDVTVNNAAGAGAVNIQDGGNSITVDGTFFQATQPVSAASLPLPSGAATLAGQTQPGVDIGDVTINNAAGASAVNIQDGGNSITVDGTVTANLGTIAGVATATQQTDGTQKAIVRGGAKGATTAADVTSTAQSADRQAVDVQIRTSAGVAVDTFGSTPATTTGSPVGITVSTAAVLVCAANAIRVFLGLTNNGTSNFFLGNTSGVTASGATMGLKLAPNGALSDFGEYFGKGDVYAIGDAVSASENISRLERT